MTQATSKASAITDFSDQLVSVKDGCAALGIRPTKLWALIRDGHLDAVRLGGRCTRIKKSSIDRLIHNGLSA